MVRAPCCEKMGLKKGPWTYEEDQILINYIRLYGHGNWRALPRQAGLLRCGKSCRLRWTNYLRPDIKRGNFSREEEDTIIKLHEMLGNRWSNIASRLPGRTDNEIKNVWHTHLKKRLLQENYENFSSCPKSEKLEYRPISPQEYSSEISNTSIIESPQKLPEIEDEFWSEVLSEESSGKKSDFPAVECDFRLQFQADAYDSMDFWCSLLTRAGELQELPQI